MAKETIDNQNVKSKRDSFRERLAQRYPDLNMDDDEAVYGQLSTDYDQYDQNKQKMDDFNKMLKDNPHAPSLVTGLVTKKNADGSDFNFIDFIIDEMGQDYIDAINGDEKAKARLKASEKEKLEASEKLAKNNEQLAANMEQEDAELDAAIKEAKLKPEAITDLIEWLYKRSDDGEDHDDDGFIWRAARYGLKKEDFLRLFQIKDFDKAVADAEERGYKRGKNEKIDQQKQLHDGKQGGKKNININGGGGAPSLPKEKSRTEQVYSKMVGM